MADLQTHIHEQQPSFQRHTSRTVQEVQILNSNHKSNSNSNICGDSPIEKLNDVDATVFLGDDLLDNDRSTSQANLYSQVFERLKDALSKESEGVKEKLF